MCPWFQHLRKYNLKGKKYFAPLVTITDEKGKKINFEYYSNRILTFYFFQRHVPTWSKVKRGHCRWKGPLEIDRFLRGVIQWNLCEKPPRRCCPKSLRVQTGANRQSQGQFQVHWERTGDSQPQLAFWNA